MSSRSSSNTFQIDFGSLKERESECLVNYVLFLHSDEEREGEGSEAGIGK